MKSSDAKKASLEELLSGYEQAAKSQGGATEASDYKAGNKAADTLAVIYAELRGRGVDAQRSLLGLLQHDDPWVRIWAAAHTLDFSPSDGQPVLQALVSMGRRYIGLIAETTLEEWKQGKLRFP